jgi:hypothetical protein
MHRHAKNPGPRAPNYNPLSPRLRPPFSSFPRFHLRFTQLAPLPSFPSPLSLSREEAAAGLRRAKFPIRSSSLSQPICARVLAYHTWLSSRRSSRRRRLRAPARGCTCRSPPRPRHSGTPPSPRSSWGASPGRPTAKSSAAFTRGWGTS